MSGNMFVNVGNESQIGPVTKINLEIGRDRHWPDLRDVRKTRLTRLTKTLVVPQVYRAHASIM